MTESSSTCSATCDPLIYGDHNPILSVELVLACTVAIILPISNGKIREISHD